jgi:tRNA A37 threonylcarbamoyladenosine dehydratase
MDPTSPASASASIDGSELIDPFEARFGGIIRLYGVEAAWRLNQARVAVVGLGGVGSWVAEALARSGVGCIRLIDLDDVCITNVNRQVIALESTVGRFKADVLCSRLRDIRCDGDFVAVQEFFTPDTADQLLQGPLDLVVDAIDDTSNKSHLIASCRERGVPVITCGGAGGRRDATRLRIADLSRSASDGLLREVRRRLRKEYSFTDEGPWGVPCVYSDEAPWFPTPDPSPGGTSPLRLNCAGGLGSATHVTGSMGFMMAQIALEHIVSPERGRQNT